MLLFGILFGFLLVINIISDIKNSINMIKYSTPEPGIDSINLNYYINSAMGFFVLIIFGTSSEAKKSISKFNTLPLHVSSNPELSYKYSNKNRNPELSYKYSSKSSNPEHSYKYSNKSISKSRSSTPEMKNYSLNSKDSHFHNNVETFSRKNRFLDSFVESNNGSDSIVYGINMLQLQELQKDSIDTINTTDSDILNEKEPNIKYIRKSGISPIELKYYSLNENADNYNKILQKLQQQLQGLQNDNELNTDTDLLNKKVPKTNRKSAVSPLELKYYSLNENVDTYNKVLQKLQQQLQGLQNDNIITTSADLLNEKESNIGSNTRSEINLYSINESEISGSKITTTTDLLTEKESNVGFNTRSELNLYSITENGITGSKVTTNTGILNEKESNVGFNTRSELNLYSISESGVTGSKVTTNTDILTEKESNVEFNTRSELNLYSITESGITGSKVTTNTGILNEKESNVEFNTRSELNLYSISESGVTGSKVTTNTDILTEKESNAEFNTRSELNLYSITESGIAGSKVTTNIGILNEKESNAEFNTRSELNLYSISESTSKVSSNKISDSENHGVNHIINEQEIQNNNDINIRNETTPVEINLYSISGSGSGVSSNKVSDSENLGVNHIINEQEIQNNNNINIRNETTPIEINLYSISGSGSGVSSNKVSDSENPENNNIEIHIQNNNNIENVNEIDNTNNEQEIPRNIIDIKEIIIKSGNEDDHNDEGNNNEENDFEIPKSEINMKSKKEIIEEMILKLQETIVDMKDQKNIK